MLSTGLSFLAVFAFFVSTLGAAQTPAEVKQGVVCEVQYFYRVTTPTPERALEVATSNLNVQLSQDPIQIPFIKDTPNGKAYSSVSLKGPFFVSAPTVTFSNDLVSVCVTVVRP